MHASWILTPRDTRCAVVVLSFCLLCLLHLPCRLAGKVSVRLPERATTFSKGRLVHVSDLLQRNSMTRSQNLPPVTSFLDANSSAGGAAAVAPAPAAAAAEHSVTSANAAGPGPSGLMAPAAQISPAAAAAVAATAAGSASGGLPTVSVIAAGVPDKAVGVQRPAVVSSRDVQLDVAGAQGHGGRGKVAPVSLTSAVAAVLQQPAPAGAYVVRDIQISRLAGELDAQL